METNQIFLLVALVASGIFLMQLLLSVFFGGVDTDIDVDADADVSSDMDMSSIVSFKGLIHFGIGFGWSMYLFDSTDWKAYLFSVVIGLIFVYVLWLLYKMVFKLQKDTVEEPAKSLEGRAATIYINRGGGRYVVQVIRNGALREVDVKSESGNEAYLVGDAVTIKKFEDSVYYIN